METALIIMATGFLCLSCFVAGAKLGQKVSRGEEITTPAVNPFKAYQERQARQEAQMEQDKMDTIMRNIESYDGTGFGQEDVPGR